MDALRLRLLLAPRQGLTGMPPAPCTCMLAIDIVEQPLHFLACNSNSELVIVRDDAVRDAVAELMQRCLPDAVVQTEVMLPTPVSPALKARIGTCPCIWARQW